MSTTCTRIPIDRRALDAAWLGLRRNDAPPEADDGRPWGRYILVRPVARGAMGEVWKAWDGQLRRWVAVKVLLDPASESARRRLHREALALAQVRHPHVAVAHDAGEHEGRPYLCMEWIDGRALAADRPLAELVGLLRQVAEGVGAVHRRGILHRDLKPANILVDDRGAHVVDFGLALAPAQDSRMTKTGIVVGTLAYLAPEQIRAHRGPVDARVDVYALGVILYELMSGRLPFRGRHWAEMAEQILRRDVEPPPGPTDLAAICLKAMAREPGRRYATAEALAEDLARFQQGRPVSARIPGWGARWLRRAQRPLLVLGLVALPVLGVGWATSGTSPAPSASSATPGPAGRAREWLLSGRQMGDRLGRLDPSDPGFAAGRQAIADEAEAHLKAALDFAPDFDEAWYELGVLQGRMGRRQEALESLDRALGITPRFLGALEARLSLCAEEYVRRRHREQVGPMPLDGETRGLRARVEADMRALREIVGASPGLLVFDGLLAFAEGDYGGAERKLREYMKYDPVPGPGIHRWLGHALLHLPGRESEALEMLEVSLKRFPEDGPGWQLKAGLLERLGRHADAIEEYGKAIACGPRNADSRWFRGLARYNAGDPSGALADLNEAVALDPTEPGMYENRAQVRLRLGDPEGARQDLERLLELAPADWPNREAALRQLDGLRRSSGTR